MSSSRPLGTREISWTYDYSSSTASPERNPNDIEDPDFFLTQSANDSSTSVAGDGDEEEISGFEDMTVSQPRPAYLPPELLFAIFGRLSSPQDLQSCVLACKSWARCAVEL